MTRALICHPDGTLEEIDLATASPEERAAAITDHRELEIVRRVLRDTPPAKPTDKETP
ncbi:hypothetical protein [Pseudomonas sp. Hp2]|uniref:hypothetical protein n=1 Tax=Pseudomonas sp. Hp2 TaxID=701189 RepID=UPI0015A8B670|nr:hypothetical protein [Pseudomonas sp. Hp2]